MLVAHTGLDHMVTVGDVWRELPMDKRIVMRWWQVPRAEIPADRDERIDWLFGWWERIDVWIDENRPADLPSGRSAELVGSGLLGGVLVDVDDLGRVVRGGHRVRLLGLVGDRLVRRRRRPRRCSSAAGVGAAAGRRRGRRVGRLPVVGLRAAAQLLGDERRPRQRGR